MAVVAIAISPDSNYVATGSKDKSVKLWEMRSGREVRSFLGHESTVNVVKFSHDGKFLLTGSRDKSVRAWDVNTGKEVFSVSPDQNEVTHISFSPDSKYFVASGYGDTARVYDFKSRVIVASLYVNAYNGSSYGVDALFSKDGKWLAFGEDNHQANVYETTHWQRKYSFEYGKGSCGGCYTLVNFSPDSKYFYTASRSGDFKKYDLATGLLIKRYMDETQEIVSLALSPDGKQVVLSSAEDIQIFESESGKLMNTLKPGFSQEMNEIQFSSQGHDLMIGCNDNVAYLINIKSGKTKMKFTGFLNQRDKGGLTYNPNEYWESGIAKYVRFKNHLLLSPDGKELIKGKFGTRVKRWDIASGKTAMEYKGHSKAVLCYALTRDGKRMITGGGEGKMMLWDLQTGDSLQSIQSYESPVLDIRFNEDESQILSSSYDAIVKVHDLKTGKRLKLFDFREFGSAYNVVWSPGDFYMFSSQGKYLKMWEMETQTVVREFIGHQDLISSLHQSPDSRWLLSSGWDGNIFIWDIGTGLIAKKLKGHKGAVHISIFSPDGRSVYSAGADRVVRLWDLATSKVIRTFEGHNAEITSLLLSPDSKLLISHSVDGATKFWDLNTGKEFFEHIHFGEREWMVKNPEGYFNGTQEARQYIHFVEGMKTYSADQFFDEFYRPDLLPRIFQNRRGGDDLKGIQGKLQDSPPPLVKIASLSTADPGKVEIYVKITDDGAGVENLKLFHNGKSVTLDRQNLRMPKGKGESTTYKHVVALVGGNNTFTASASNKDNIEADPASLEVLSDVATKSSTCYVMAVGINQYKNPKMTLNYARPDAESFSQVMDEEGSLFKNVELINLYDGEASRARILEKLDEISGKIQQDDVFIFYYAGHGSMVDDQFFFIPSESLRLYDLSSLKKEALEASVLQEKFKNIKALKQLIIMDACQSGASIELLATRGAAEEKAIAQLSRSAGIHVMASAGSEQFATEFAELGHGLFTYLLIKALKGDADGAPKDGKVTIYELKSYLDDQVPEMTRQLKGKPQYPYTFSRGQDFPIVIEK